MCPAPGNPSGEWDFDTDLEFGWLGTGISNGQIKALSSSEDTEDRASKAPPS